MAKYTRSESFVSLDVMSGMGAAYIAGEIESEYQRHIINARVVAAFDGDDAAASRYLAKAEAIETLARCVSGYEGVGKMITAADTVATETVERRAKDRARAAKRGRATAAAVEVALAEAEIDARVEVTMSERYPVAIHPADGFTEEMVLAAFEDYAFYAHRSGSGETVLISG